MTITYGYVTTPVGKAFLALSKMGICMLSFVERWTEEEHLQYLKTHWAGNYFLPDDQKMQERADTLFVPYKIGMYPSLLLGGSLFQKKVWLKLMEIPFGTTTTYSQIAAMIGKPKAVRAVATAIGKNEISYIIPCHRVVRSDGSIGGYRWGVEVKKALLEWEKQQL